MSVVGRQCSGAGFTAAIQASGTVNDAELSAGDLHLQVFDGIGTLIWDQHAGVTRGSSTRTVTITTPVFANARQARVLMTSFPSLGTNRADIFHCIPGAPGCCGNPGSCEDNNGCTQDGCDPWAGCTHTPLTNSPCNDGKACTTNDHCDSSGTCVGTNTCADNNPCTTNTCTVNGCTFTPKAVGTQCRENPDNPCTTGGPNSGTCNANGICGSCRTGVACVIGCGGGAGTCSRIGTVCTCR